MGQRQVSHCGWSSVLCYTSDTVASIWSQGNNTYTKAIVLYVVKEIASHTTSGHHESQLEGVCATCRGGYNGYFHSH